MARAIQLESSLSKKQILRLYLGLAPFGGRVTGVDTVFFELAPKWLQLLTEMLPGVKRVGLLFAPDFLGRAFSKSNPYTAEAATEVEIRRLVDDIVTATEAEILDAMRFMMERLKLVTEPSSAVPVALATKLPPASR